MIRNADNPTSTSNLTTGSAVAAGQNPDIIKRPQLRRVCAWCKKTATDGIEWPGHRWTVAADTAVTHGICPQCATRFE